MSPGTEFARDFCAGIGPLQLGVVLVYKSYGCMQRQEHVTIRPNRIAKLEDAVLCFITE